MNYNFTANWFDSDENQEMDLRNVLPYKTNDEIYILEIGSYKGKSAFWFVENFLTLDFLLKILIFNIFLNTD